MDENHTSSLLKYLPNSYSDDDFMGGFLNIFEALWLPLDRQIDQLYAYFDPLLTPAEFLPWLGTWVDLVLDENWPESRRRILIENAADLYRRRGTTGALRDYLAIYLGTTPTIVEDGLDGNPFHFSVTIRTGDGQDPDSFDQDRVRRIIDEEKPAHTIYTLTVTK
ncbi:MAG: phage tail protein [Anaerolineaceae bacterium]